MGLKKKGKTERRKIKKEEKKQKKKCNGKRNRMRVRS